MVAANTAYLITKLSVQGRLNDMFIELQTLTRPDNMSLGGVAGEGCRDLRGRVRRTKDPIWTAEGVDDWRFSGSHFESPTSIEILDDFAHRCRRSVFSATTTFVLRRV